MLLNLRFKLLNLRSKIFKSIWSWRKVSGTEWIRSVFSGQLRSLCLVLVRDCWPWLLSVLTFRACCLLFVPAFRADFSCCFSDQLGGSCLVAARSCLLVAIAVRVYFSCVPLAVRVCFSCRLLVLSSLINFVVRVRVWRLLVRACWSCLATSCTCFVFFLLASRADSRV